MKRREFFEAVVAGIAASGITMKAETTEIPRGSTCVITFQGKLNMAEANNLVQTLRHVQEQSGVRFVVFDDGATAAKPRF